MVGCPCEPACGGSGFFPAGEGSRGVPLARIAVRVEAAKGLPVFEGTHGRRRGLIIALRTCSSLPSSGDGRGGIRPVPLGQPAGELGESVEEVHEEELEDLGFHLRG